MTSGRSILDSVGMDAYRHAAYIQLPVAISTSAEIILTFRLAAASSNLQMLRDL